MNPRGKGRVSKNASIETPWKSGIACQRFFRSTPGYNYFLVDPEKLFPAPGARPRRSSSIIKEEEVKEIERSRLFLIYN